jgi:hypothetical protein
VAGETEEQTEKRIERLKTAYQLFNARRVDELLDLLTEDVEWPDVTRNVVLHSKDAIRAYWLAQFAVASPVVVPAAFVEAEPDIVVTVDQQVLDLEGNPLTPPAVVYHRYAFRGDLVARMTVVAA